MKSYEVTTPVLVELYRSVMRKEQRTVYTRNGKKVKDFTDDELAIKAQTWLSQARQRSKSREDKAI